MLRCESFRREVADLRDRLSLQELIDHLHNEWRPRTQAPMRIPATAKWYAPGCHRVQLMTAAHSVDAHEEYTREHARRTCEVSIPATRSRGARP